MKPETIVVLDVGKSNKKAAVYNRDFAVLAEIRISLGPAEWQGLEIERTDELLAWFRAQLAAFAGRFDIRAIGVSAHGATLSLLDGAGDLALPVISYTSPVSGDIQGEFYREFGDRDTLHRATGTPDLGFVNMAKVLHYIRTRLPVHWAAARSGLFYPQFFAHALSGVAALDPTYVGNHSYLWDFGTRSWSGVARELGADRLFSAPMHAPWDALGPLRPDWQRDTGIGPNCVVATGIHDSNANLLPYLVRDQSDFILASTGTWCVLMRPASSPILLDDQIAAGVFFNQSAFNGPVLTGLLPAGMEYETFAGFAPFADAQDQLALAEVVAARDTFIVPGVLPDVPVYPGATPGLVVRGQGFTLDELRAGRAAESIRNLGPRYHAALNLALALATRRALAHLDAPHGARIYIEGGFAANALYCRLLATLCADYRWVLTHAKEGTSFGAALCAWAAAGDTTPKELAARFTIETTPVAAMDPNQLDLYAQEFKRLLREK